jgi:DNA-binding beta-propeller fold protein YncE
MRIILRVVAIATAAGLSARCGGSVDDAFFANAGGKLIRIEAHGVNKVKVTEVGPAGVDGCGALAEASNGTLYSVCGEGISKPGPQRLATVDRKTGHATPIGETIQGLQIMGLKFGSDGKLYTVGDANPASPTFSSLYTVNVNTGAVTRIGSTGAHGFFHDFALDPKGTMYASSSDALYTIDLKSGIATKAASFVGGGGVMGLAFSADGSRLYATDFKDPVSDVYLVDVRTGFLTALGTTGYPFAHGLAPANR